VFRLRERKRGEESVFGAKESLKRRREMVLLSLEKKKKKRGEYVILELGDEGMRSIG